MSRQLIHEYRADLDRIRAIPGSNRESVLRDTLKMLLYRGESGQHLSLAPEDGPTADKVEQLSGEDLVATP